MANKPARVRFLNRTRIPSGLECTKKKDNRKGLYIQTSIPLIAASETKSLRTARNKTCPLPSPFPSNVSTTEGSLSFMSGFHPAFMSPVTLSPDPYSSSPDVTVSTPFAVSTIISSFLYLGPEPTLVEELDKLKRLEIRRVLNMAVECEDKLGMKSKFEVYRKLGMSDTVEEQGVVQRLNDACAYIDDALLHECPTYIYCRAGRSRSVTVVIAYLIRHYRWSLKKAYEYVLEQRREISPNIGFMADLLAFEKIEFGGSAPSLDGLVNK